MPRARRKPIPESALVPTGQPYGARGPNEQLARDLAHPQPAAPAPAAGPQGIPGGPRTAEQAALEHPPEFGDLSGPTQRPGEPLTAGLPVGPGPGPTPGGFGAPIDPLIHAAAVLNNIGGNADADTLRLRALINATLGNSAAP